MPMDAPMKNLPRKRAALAALLLFIVASPAFAATPVPTASAPSACARLIASFPAIEKRLGDGTAAINAVHARREEELAERRGRHDDSRMNLDEGRPQRRQQLAERLRAAASDGQRRAVGTFTASLESAWQERREAIEAANAKFRAWVDRSVHDRRAAVETAVTDFHAALKEAMGKVRASCAPGAGSDGVERRFAEAARAAQAEFREALESADGISGGVEDHVFLRRAEIEEADAAFGAALRLAHATLKSALANVR